LGHGTYLTALRPTKSEFAGITGMAISYNNGNYEWKWSPTNSSVPVVVAVGLYSLLF
jgi:hypothetical protein